MQSDNYSARQSDKNNLIWYNQFEELLEYKKQYGHCNVPSTHENQIVLFQWVNQQRDNYAKLNMSDERINMLSAIGFDWTTTQEDRRNLKTRPNNYEKIKAFKPNNWTTTEDKFWNDKFEELNQYKSKHGHCNVPQKHDENQSLAYWVQRQRYQFTCSKLSEERFNLLNGIGFKWSISKDKVWNDKFEELQLYKSKHGHCNVPQKHDENQPLASWVNRQRSQFTCSKLSEERINLLNGIGFNWRSVSYDKVWNDKFEELKLYKSKHGDCNVSAKYDENQPLYNWVHRQRNQLKYSKMSEERIVMLIGIGFNWTAQYDKIWNDKFEELKQYKSKHGDFNVSHKNNLPLANWVQLQRSRFKHSKMTEERINMLNAIGFNWKSGSTCITWNDRFEQLKQYTSKYGDCNVPVRYDENRPLASWVQTQRSRYKHSKLSEERINMLNAIGFNWTAPKRMNKKRQLMNHEQIAIERSYQDSKEKETTTHVDAKEKEEHLVVDNEINKKQEDTEQEEVEENHEQVDAKEKEKHLVVDNEINTEEENTELEEVEEIHEQIAIETSHQDSREKETTAKEKGEISSFKRSLQDRVQVLCTISIMFQEQKDAIYADMKRRKLDNSA